MFERVLNTPYFSLLECYIFQENKLKWNMALLGKLYRSRLKQQKELGLLSLEFLFLLVQKQNSAFKLANCDLQINFVFLQITLSIFLNEIYESKQKILNYTLFSWIGTFFPPKPLTE